MHLSSVHHRDGESSHRHSPGRSAVTRGEFLGGCLVALLITCAPGLAGVVVTALTGPDRLDAPTTSRDGVGEDPSREASPWMPPVPRASTREASRSRAVVRHAAGGVGGLTDTTCYTETGSRTASGLWPEPGMAASNRYPFGTRLRVESVGVVVVQDRIGAHSSLDLFFASRAECLRFGRQQLRVEVLP